jgi:hypothetical protein
MKSLFEYRSIPSVFEPDFWQKYINATCYTYVLNIITNERFYVGDIYRRERAEKTWDNNKLIECLTEELEYLGFCVRLVDLNEKTDYQKICMVRSPEIGYYHFYRQDSDGLWSHKRPNQLPNRVTLDGKLITNPFKDADPGYDIGYCFELMN